jgi:phage terminase small subunit
MTNLKAIASTPLTDREKLFVAEYVISGKQTEAYIKAGYSAKSASSNAIRMMEKESVRGAIAREQAMIRQRHTKTTDDVIAEYTRMGFTGMSRFMRISDDGAPVVDLSDCTPADLDLLAEVTVESYQEGSGKEPRRIKRIKIKPYDRYHALDKLADHLGLFKGADTVASDPLGNLLRDIQERGSTLPVRVDGPLGSRKKPWKQ